MVLGYGGFTGLSSTEYRRKLRTATVEELKRQEIVKIRHRIASLWSCASGIAWAYFTFGGSLVVTGIGGRKWRVADRKLEIIRAELANRGEELHKLTWKDFAIPLSACAVGTAVGAGIDVGIGSLIDINDIATSGSGGTLASPNGNHSQDLQAMFSHPDKTIQGVGEGVVIQPELVAHAGTQHAADALGVPPSEVPIQTIDFNNPGINENLAQLGGAQLGIDIATSLERGAGQLLAQELIWWANEAFETPQGLRHVKDFHGCTRYSRVQNMSCNACKMKITQGQYWRKYWHRSFSFTRLRSYVDCCECKNDDFDLCDCCYEEGSRCMCRETRLRQLQFAWDGNLFPPQRREASVRFKTLAKVKKMACDICGIPITQGRFFSK